MTRRYWSGTRGEGQTAKWLRLHVNHDGEGCLIWPFSRVRGYGNLSYLGKMHYAHTFMCELANGQRPTPEHQPAHSCGRGEDGCVHPKHLSWKTPSQNQLDKREHGTAYRLGRHKKLTEDIVVLVCSLRGVLTHDQMAECCGVSRRTIGAIFEGRSWQNVFAGGQSRDET